MERRLRAKRHLQKRPAGPKVRGVTAEPTRTTGANPMAEEQPSLHIDTDWKKQAQAEKQKLAEREQREREQREQRAQQSAAAAPGIIAPGVAAGPAGVAAAAVPA